MTEEKPVELSALQALNHLYSATQKLNIPLQLHQQYAACYQAVLKALDPEEVKSVDNSK